MPVEPRTKIQDSWASWFLVLGSTGLVALKCNFLMRVLMQTGRWKPYNYSRNTSAYHFMCHMATAAVKISERIAVLDGLIT